MPQFEFSGLVAADVRRRMHCGSSSQRMGNAEQDSSHSVNAFYQR
jgi:hypothetical protein